jgi:hypothetical protein
MAVDERALVAREEQSGIRDIRRITCARQWRRVREVAFELRELALVVAV